MKYLQIIATLAGIASAGVAVATYFTKAGGGGRHRDPPAASSGPAHNAPGAGSGSAEAPRGAGRQGGAGEGGKK